MRRVSGVFSQGELATILNRRGRQPKLSAIPVNTDIAGGGKNRYYQVEAIRAACNNIEAGNRKSLLVMATGTGKERVARKGGAAHVVTPVNLTYSDGNYYLVAYSASGGEIRNYRVDRMGQMAVTGERVDRNEVIASCDPDEAARTAFGMYDGERVVMTLKNDADLMNVVVDRFGRDVDAVPSDDGKTATVTASVRERPVLYGWIAMLGDGAELLRPKALRDGYADWLKGILGKYEV